MESEKQVMQLEKFQRKATEMIKGLKCIFWRQKLKRFGFSIENRKL